MAPTGYIDMASSPDGDPSAGGWELGARSAYAYKGTLWYLGMRFGA